MNEYSEQDIQDYADGTFAGDVKDLEEYLGNNARAQKELKQYKALFSAIGDEDLPSLSIDLGSSVVARLEKRKESREASWTKLAFFVLAALMVIAVSLCFSYFGMHKLFNAAGIIYLIALVSFVIAFHFIEFRVKNKKFLQAY